MVQCGCVHCVQVDWDSSASWFCVVVRGIGWVQCGHVGDGFSPWCLAGTATDMSRENSEEILDVLSDFCTSRCFSVPVVVA